MNVECQATIIGDSLECRIPDSDWFFSIHQHVGKSHGSFFDFNDHQMSPSEISATFLPNWKEFKWTPGNDDEFLGKSLSFAKDLKFSVKVQCVLKSDKTHQEVVDAFLDFMSDR